MSVTPIRHFKLSGASNFRDLGGYPTSDGRTVRWRQIFRSNHLGNLTDDDVSVLRELGVRSAFDFRGTEERVAALCGMPEITVHSLPVEPTVVAALRAIAASGTPLSTDHAVEVMRELGIDISSHRSKSVDEFLEQEFDYVITVCDNANEQCPAFPGRTKRIHWSFEDPAAAQGDESARLGVFRRVRDEISERLEEFIRSGS